MKASILFSWFACSVCLLLAVGTPGKAEKREETDAESYVASNDKAVLVLVRNRALLGTVKFRVIDEKRHCRGVLKGRSHVGMVINPGKQKLYVLAAKRAFEAGNFEKSAAQMALFGNEGDNAIGGVRKRLVEGGHHHNAAGEEAGIYDEGFVIVTKKDKNKALAASKALREAKDDTARQAAWDDFDAVAKGLIKGN